MDCSGEVKCSAVKDSANKCSEEPLGCKNSVVLSTSLQCNVLQYISLQFSASKWLKCKKKIIV